MTALLLLACLTPAPSADWPQWRGPTGDGVSSETDFPTEWDGPSGKNIRWKVPILGAGNSSPILHGQDLILTATSGIDHSELHIFCFDRATGKQRARRDLTATPADPPFKMFPPERGHAASTPVVTDKAIYAFFGTGDLVCLDRDCRLVWLRSLATEFGPIRNDYGIAASPIVADDKLLVQVDHLGGSYLLAADLTTGKTLWRSERRGIYDNWSTPILVTAQGRRQVVCLGTKKIIGYDLADGKELWSVAGVERLCSCTPIVRGERVYVTSGPNGVNLALDLSAAATPKLLWQSKKTGPFVPSAIVVGDLYFVANDQGVAECLDLQTGRELWKERLGAGRTRSSPVAAAGRIYFTALDGSTTVVKAAGTYDLLAKNKLGEEVAASAALSDGCIYFRSEKHLWCIGR